mgnify:CR=1 FL=1
MSTKVQHGLAFATPGTTIGLGAASSVPWNPPGVGSFVVAGLAQANSPGNPTEAETPLDLVTAIRTNTAANIRCSMYAGITPAGGSWDTLTFDTGDSDNLTLEAVELTHPGAASWTTHVPVSAGAEVTSGVSIGSGNIVITDPNAVLVVLVGFQGSQPGAGQPSFSGTGWGWVANNRFGAMAVRIPGAAGTYSTTCSWANPANAFVITAAFAPVVAAGGRKLQMGGLRL